MCALLNPLDSVADLELQWRSSFQEVNVIVAGKFRSGKTELFNGLCRIRIEENNNPDTKEQRNNFHAFEEQEIKVWDTCAMYKDSHLKSKAAIKRIREIKCMQNAGIKKILLYTVPMNQTRFIPSVENNTDLNCLRRLTSEFGVEIWRHAIIILTFANDQYEQIHDDLGGESIQETRSLFYSQEIAGWESSLKECLRTINIPDDLVKNISFLPAGYVRHEHATSHLACDVEGKSWVWNIWQEIVKVSPNDYKHQILQLCFDKVCSDPFLYGDSYLSFVKLHGVAYSDKAFEARTVGCTEREEVYRNIGLNYSYLRLLKRWFNSHDILAIKLLKCSQDCLTKMEAWRSLQVDIKIIVSGKENSGKSTLIKFMIHNKFITNEFSDIDGEWKSSYKNISCSFREVAPLQLQSDQVRPSALVIVCVKLSATKEILTRALAPIVKKNPKNIMVVLTFADENLSTRSWTELVHIQSRSVRDTLQELQLNEGAMSTLRVTPAGYQTTIKEDPAKKNWVMDVWLKCIASANGAHQSSLAVFVNHFIYGGKKLKTEASHKEYFREHLMNLLSEMIAKHNIEY